MPQNPNTVWQHSTRVDLIKHCYGWFLEQPGLTPDVLETADALRKHFGRLLWDAVVKPLNPVAPSNVIREGVTYAYARVIKSRLARDGIRVGWSCDDSEPLTDDSLVDVVVVDEDTMQDILRRKRGEC